MKKEIILVLLLFSSLVSADQYTFLDGMSHEIDGKNITLIKFDPLEDKSLFCVNGKRWIIEEDDSKTLNDVYIDVLRIKSDRVDTDIEYRCKNCVCDETCDNSVCFDIEEEVMEEEIIEEPDLDAPIEDKPKEEVITEKVKEEVIEPAGIGSQTIIIAVLILVIIVLGVIVLWRRH